MSHAETSTCSSECASPLEDPASAPVEVRGAELRRALRLVTAAWLFGSVWMYVTAGTPVTNFAKGLGASEFQFGLLSALPFLASLLTIPGSLLVEATGSRRKVFLFGLYTQRLLWFAIALLPLLLLHWYGPAAKGRAMTLFLVLMFLMYAGGWMGTCGWQSWMADLVPERTRGKYFARRRQWGILPSIPVVCLVAWGMDRWGGGDSMRVLWGCAIVFMCAAVFGLVDITIFLFVPDIPKPPQKGIGLLRAMRKPLHDKQYLWFAGFVATLFFAVSFMGQFATKYVLEEVGGQGSGHASKSINVLTQLMLIVVPILAQLPLFGLFGRAADRMGKKPMLVIAALGLTPVAVGWVFLTSGNIWLGFILASAGAVLWCGVEIAQLNLIFEMSGTQDEKNGNGSGSSAYVAVNSVITNIAGFFGGISAGVIAQFMSNHHMEWNIGFKTFKYYDVLFLLSAGLRFAAVVIFLPHIKEPEARPTREVVRFMAANIYNNLFSMVQQPLRMLGVVRREAEDEAETEAAAVPPKPPKPREKAA